MCPGRDAEWHSPPDEMCELDALGSARGASATVGLLKRLPVWTGVRIERAGSQVMLPGLQAWFSVQKPQHSQLFSELLAGCGPHLFGAIVLEDQQEESDLVRASGNVGTLMEVAGCKRCKDGRIDLHVIGICRIRMDASQRDKEETYLRANCVVLPGNYSMLKSVYAD
jgi:ATP-dependent Lon protease